MESSNEEVWPGLEILAGTILSRATQTEASGSGLSEEMALLHQGRLLLACAPAEFGGIGLGQNRETAVLAFEILRRLGRASLPVTRLFEGHMNALKLIALYGSDDAQARLFKGVSNGQVFGVWGADGRPAVTYEIGDGAAVLSGQKAFASGLGCVGVAIITAASVAAPGTSRLFCVDVSDVGRQNAAAWTAAGMKATLSGTFEFEGLGVGPNDFLGESGDYQKEPHFDGGVWRYCAAHIGGAESLIDRTLEAMADRGHLKDPIQLARLGRIIGSCRAAASLVREWAIKAESPSEDQRETAGEIAASVVLARTFVADMVIDVLQQCERCLGTSAHLQNTTIERIRRDLSLYIRQAAPDAKHVHASEQLCAPSKGPSALW
jgi:alkylation response protein AidB-like acyl-CoA dehydrogenase